MAGMYDAEYVFDRKGNRWIIGEEDGGLDDESKWALEQYQNGLSSLTLRQREVIRLRVDNVTFSRIGEKLGVSPQRAHRIMKSAQRKLLKQYKREE